MRSDLFNIILVQYTVSIYTTLVRCNGFQAFGNSLAKVFFLLPVTNVRECKQISTDSCLIYHVLRLNCSTCTYE